MKSHFVFLIFLIASAACSPLLALKPPPDPSLNVAFKVRIYQGPTASVSLESNNLTVTEKEVRHGKSVIPLADGYALLETKEAVKFGTHQYTGKIHVFVKGERMRLLNEVFLEDYIPGVLASEISYSWHDEAIQAQAVAARSYAYATWLQTKDEAYQIDASASSQEFAGTYAPHPKLVSATKKTAGQILTYYGEPIHAFFHACSGGETERASEVWTNADKKYGYLQNVRTRYCETHPLYQWTTNLSLDEASGALKSYFSNDTLVSLKAKSLTRTGRIKLITLVGRKESRDIDGNSFRLAIGASKLPSLLFTIRQTGDQLVFSGKGFGHGVGLCQWSAKTMAERGYGYQEILFYFYKNVRLTTISKLTSPGNDPKK